MIQLTLPAGVLTAEARISVQKELAAVLLKWEGAPDTAFFRAQAWVLLDEVDFGRFGALEDGAPRFRVDVTVPEGALSARRKKGLVREATQIVLAAAGLDESEALRVWVLIHEQTEGTWGAGGAVIKFQELATLAQAQRSEA